MGHAMSFFVDIYVPSNIKINKASVHVRAYKKPKKDVMLVLSHLHSFGKMILFPDDKYKLTYFFFGKIHKYLCECFCQLNAQVLLYFCVFISCKDKGIFVFFATNYILLYLT